MAVPRDVAIVGVYATKQGRNLGRTSLSLTMEAFHGGLADGGLTVADVDGWFNFDFPAGNGQGLTQGNVAFQLGRPMTVVGPYSGVPALLYASAAIRDGLADVIVIPFGGAQEKTDGSTVAYTRPGFEFTEWTGSTTPAQMALQMKRHMAEFGTTREQLGYAAAVLRNNAHLNPDAVMFDRGPYTVDDILTSRMVADPFTLLMCALVNDGGSCVVVASAEKAKDCRHPPVWVLAGGIECNYTSYYEPPTLAPLTSQARMNRAFTRAGLTHDDIDFVTTYDHFASGVIMEYEAAGFCEVGEGGPFTSENIGLDDRFPVSPDGGCIGYSHNINPYNFRIIEAVKQMRNYVPDRCPGWEQGEHTFDRSMCRKVRDPRYRGCLWSNDGYVLHGAVGEGLAMAYDKPLPHITALARPFWDGTHAHELRLQRCRACNSFQFPPQVLCRTCLNEEQEWTATSGRATVYSFVVQHRPATPAFTDDLPYVVAVVELDEGPLMLTNIVECSPDEVSVGMPVEVTFVDATDEITLYPFRPIASA